MAVESVWYSRSMIVLVFTLCGIVDKIGGQFTAVPQDQEVYVYYGGSARSFYLDCQVSSLGQDDNVSWYKNDIIISDGYQIRGGVGDIVDKDRYLVTSGGRDLTYGLLVFNVTVETAEKDSGRYACAVSQYFAPIQQQGVIRVMTDVVTVTAYAVPHASYPKCSILHLSGKEIETGNTPIGVLVGEPLSFECSSDPGIPAVELNWYRNEEDTVIPLASQSYKGERPDGLSVISFNWTPTSPGVSTLTFTCTLQHPGFLAERKCTLGPFDVIGDNIAHPSPLPTAFNAHDHQKTLSISTSRPVPPSTFLTGQQNDDSKTILVIVGSMLAGVLLGAVLTIAVGFVAIQYKGFKLRRRDTRERAEPDTQKNSTVSYSYITPERGGRFSDSYQYVEPDEQLPPSSSRSTGADIHSYVEVIPETDGNHGDGHYESLKEQSNNVYTGLTKDRL